MHIDRLERYWMIIVIIILASFFAALVAGAVVFGVRLPAPIEKINPRALLDSPEYGTPGKREVVAEDGSVTYEWIIHAQKWNFVTGSEERNADGKDILRVKQGDEVTFIVTSRDITHGFMIEHHNVNFEVVPGEIARITTTFNRPGEYAVLCHEYCGIQHQGMWALIVVEPASATSAQN